MSVTNASALRPGASTFLVHVFGRGLKDKTYVVERYRSAADGQIRRLPGGKHHPLTLSLATVRELRPARNEILICKGEQKPDSGVQYWGAGAVFGYMLERSRVPG
ncbi:MAG: hypothetical protein OXN81_01700 [Alphaproteobacteria bacterium]|nr:hypothetical protein [Alphaproteobacteria bacterium]